MKLILMKSKRGRSVWGPITSEKERVEEMEAAEDFLEIKSPATKIPGGSFIEQTKISTT